jgi:hypothetical protein
MKAGDALVELNNLVMTSGEAPRKCFPRLSEEARHALAKYLAGKYGEDVEGGLTALAGLFPKESER